MFGSIRAEIPNEHPGRSFARSQRATTNKMILNSGLQSKEESMSEKSEVASIRSENPARIEDIFDWIDGIPLSKTTKNLARDFADAVLMAEILKFYYPSLVCSHNYIPSNSVQNKRENWNTLNRKVLTKIGLQLSSETINQLAHSQVGVIEKVLSDFRDKQMATNVKIAGPVEPEFEEPEESHITENDSITESNQTSIFAKFFGAIANFFTTIFGFVLTILCFWKWFSRSVPNTEELTNEEDMEELEAESAEQDEQLRESYAQAMRELQMKSDYVKTLHHKVAFLEGSIKLKDMKIASLTSQIKQQQSLGNEMLSKPPGAASISSIKNTRRRSRQ